MIVAGHLYDRGSSNRVAARLSGRRDRYVLTTDDGGETVVDVISAAPFINGIPQRLVISTGQTFVPFGELPQGFLGGRRNRVWRALSRAERFSPGTAAVCVVLLAGIVVSLRAALPALADAAAHLVPGSLEAAVGRSTFAQLEYWLLEPSDLSPAQTVALRRAAKRLVEQQGMSEPPRVLFRNAPKIGANAFALPGGPVVVTDQLVDLMESEDLVVAVIAHELGHVEERHAVRQMLRATGLLILFGAILGADEVFVEELSAFALSLATSGYSREFESAADAYAVRLLRDAGHAPEAFIAALEALAAECGPPCAEESWFSTHPSIETRIEAMRELVGNPGGDPGR